MKILIFGVTGMLGNTLFRYLSQISNLNVYGIYRNDKKILSFKKSYLKRLIKIKEIDSSSQLKNILKDTKPDVVINCIGITKNNKYAADIVHNLNINSIFPHKLKKVFVRNNVRLIHFSTDCVFDGKKGNYNEKDFYYATDIYGISKRLGELTGKNCITIRTSIIGHEISTKFGLLEWFLASKKYVKGYQNAFFTGLPTIEISKIIYERILSNKNLRGIFHISGPKISKFDLLKIISKVYKKNIIIKPDNVLKIDRSLNSSKFDKISGYKAKDWHTLIKNMKLFHDQQ